jgi:hypothetical protein
MDIEGFHGEDLAAVRRNGGLDLATRVFHSGLAEGLAINIGPIHI